MGQSNSSRRRPEGDNSRDQSTPRIVLSPPDTSSASEQTNHETTAASGSADKVAKRSRRASLRQGLKNLVTSSSSDSVRSRVASTVSSNSTSSTSSPSRRRWTRRWSKLPAGSPPLSLAEGQHTDLSSMEAVAEDDGGVGVPDQLSVGKGKEKSNDRFEDLPSSLDDGMPGQSRPFSSVLSSEPCGSSSDATPDLRSFVGAKVAETRTSSAGDLVESLEQPQSHADHQGTAESANTSDDLQGSNPDDILEHNLPTPLVDSSPNSQPEAAHTEPSQSSPSPLPSGQTTSPRLFPPPGTLVVVQGVVHTTDAPRNPENTSSSSSHAPSHSANNTSVSGNASHGDSSANHPSPSQRPDTPIAERTGGSRLSAFISGNAGIRQRSRTRHRADQQPTDVPIRTSTSSDAAPASLDDRRSSTSADASMASASAPSDSSNSSENQSQSGGPASSIEVLGTLLSVAAAATAASLLTGSSDPIFNSGFSPTDLNGSAPSPPSPAGQNGPDRPMSPTPTAGLGGLFPALLAPHAASGYASGQGGSRWWSNLRERLGLRGTAGNGDDGDAARLRADGTPMNPRELMLAELARAFNMGLGGLGFNTQGNGPNAGQNPFSIQGDAPLPPEDSFERFLMGLQDDLRVALSGDVNDSRTTVNSGPEDQQSPTTTTRDGNSPEETHTSEETASPEETSVPEVMPESERATDDLSGLPPLVDSDSDSDGSESDDEGRQEERGHPRADDEIEHILQSLEREYENTTAVPDVQPASVPPPSNANDAPIPGSSSRTERSPGGGINWWRMYRFPHVFAPQGQSPYTTPPDNHDTTNGGANVSGSSEPNVPSSAENSNSGEAGASGQPEQPSSATADSLPPNSVIPVILVGLQTVGSRRRGQQPGDSNPPTFFPEETDDLPEEDVDESASANGDGDNGRRSGTWQSRAANAFRNLRPSRRAGQGRTTEGGSRTFLIYVIGGYYQPDHPLLHNPNQLSSFEALWRLAELFSSAKPPTVSKEDIEKSGLEIIKPSELSAYEKDGKIASNCVDRCLICLDDYGPEDDVRILTCRHGFHKNCVDKWLETGRNNCPACRSTGVSTDRPTS